MGIPILVPPWEDVGTLPPEGLRNFIPATFAKAKYMDALVHRNHQDHVAFKEFLEKYGTATRLLFDDLKTLSGTETGFPPKPGVIGRWPCWVFSGIPPAPSKVEEVFFFFRLGATAGAIKIQWTTPDHTGKRCVWGLDVQSVPVGGSLDAGGSSAVQVATAATQANVRNETTFAFGPVAAADSYIGIRLFRDAASTENDDIPVYLLGVEAVIV